MENKIIVFLKSHFKITNRIDVELFQIYIKELLNEDFLRQFLASYTIKGYYQTRHIDQLLDDINTLTFNNFIINNIEILNNVFLHNNMRYLLPEDYFRNPIIQKKIRLIDRTLFNKLITSSRNPNTIENQLLYYLRTCIHSN